MKIYHSPHCLLNGYSNITTIIKQILIFNKY